MLINLWSALCRRQLVDRKSNSISLIDVVDRIVVDDPPEDGGENPRDTFYLVSTWYYPDSPEEPFLFRLNVRDEKDEAVLCTEPVPVRVSPTGHARSVGEIGVEIDNGGGILFFHVETRLPTEEQWRRMSMVAVEVRTRSEESTRRAHGFGSAHRATP